MADVPAPCHHWRQEQDAHWQQAVGWLRTQRKHAPANADVWHLRFHWPSREAALYRQVTHGDYRLQPVQIVTTRNGPSQAMWCAENALVLKWVALHLQSLLPQHPACTHLKGHGGWQGCVRQLTQQYLSGEYRFFCRTDIRGYYRHINKEQVMDMMNRYVASPVLRDLVRQYLYYTVEEGGVFHTPDNGISRGCALSPLIGGSLLYEMDVALIAHQRAGVYYARYMDDVILLSERRWPLKRAIRTMNDFFTWGGFERHPDKTLMGRTERGFDWLGHRFRTDGVTTLPRA